MSRYDVYNALVDALSNSPAPVTTSDLVARLGCRRERALESLALLRHQKRIHVWDWAPAASGYPQKIWAWGTGVDAPKPTVNSTRRKNNPSIYSLVEAQLKVMPMTAEQVEERIYRNRGSVNIALKYLLDLGCVHIVCKGRNKSGRLCNVYGLGAGPFEDVVGAEEGVVVPHKLPCTRCDAENV